MPERRLHPVEGAAAHAAIMDGARALASHGISFGEPKVDLAKLRAFKDKVVGKLTGGLAGMAKVRKVTVVQGVGVPRPESPRGGNEGRQENRSLRLGDHRRRLAGGEASVLPARASWTRRARAPVAAEKMLVIGGGIIGLEMGTVYSTLGARLDVVEMMDGLMLGADRDLVAVWQKFNAPRFDKVMLKTKTTKAEAEEGIRVSFDGAEAKTYDMVLVSVGRVPNGKKDCCGQGRSERGREGFIPVDSQMRTNVANIYAIGDIAGNPMLAHKAVHEATCRGGLGHEVALRRARRAFGRVHRSGDRLGRADRGRGEEQRRGDRRGEVSVGGVRRAIANARDEGFTKLIFDAETHRIVGGGIVGTGAGDLISELALAVEMGADATDIGKTIHPHPTTAESVGMAAEVFEGVCTDCRRSAK